MKIHMYILSHQFITFHQRQILMRMTKLFLQTQKKRIIIVPDGPGGRTFLAKIAQKMTASMDPPNHLVFGN